MLNERAAKRRAAQPHRARPSLQSYPRPRRKSIAFTQVMPSSDEGGVMSRVTLVAGAMPDEDVPQSRVDGIELLPQQIEKIGAFDHGLSPLNDSAGYCGN